VLVLGPTLIRPHRCRSACLRISMGHVRTCETPVHHGLVLAIGKPAALLGHHFQPPVPLCSAKPLKWLVKGKSVIGQFIKAERLILRL
jgi:hypothetical protein